MFRINQLLVCGTLACLFAFTAGGCASAKGKTGQEKRDYAMAMKTRAMETVYAKKPEAQAEVEHAPGYAVIDDFSWGIGFFGSGGGYGILTDNTTKKSTYIKLFHLLPGFGFGGASSKQIVVFNDAEQMAQIVRDAKWDTGGDAEAVFKFGDTGGSALASGSFDKKIKVYEVTNDGILLRADISINQYSRDKNLNEQNP